MYADMTKRKLAEEHSRRSAERFELAARATESAVYEWDYATRTTRWTETFTGVFGYEITPETEEFDWWLARVHEDDREAASKDALESPVDGETYVSSFRFQAADGTWRHVLDRGIAFEDGGGIRTIGAMIDITDQVRLAEDLRQAQKLEAIGRLAGGVAHDFNNLLTAIAGYGELALAKAGRGEDATREIQETLRSAERAAALTKQLLAFGRKQILQPRIVELNHVVGGLDELLGRLIGEDIELETRLGSGVGAVEVDPSQVEQIVVNLALNARDAMPGGGRLVLRTAPVEVGPGELEDVGPGSYALLAVSDTGTGMDEATRARIFEPFFTTKEPGRGTGLGLATVYGIVKQSGGAIRTETAPGEGASFQIYFPRVDRAVAEQEASPAQPEPEAGKATVLLVEDEEVVRTLVREILEGRGFDVLEAPTPGDALAVAAARTGRIDLLLTDVVMPRMSGRELAQRFAQLHPESRLLYMSGYTDGAIVSHGVLSEGTMFLQKPFTMESLLAKIGEVLKG
jgi:PAS domain S-box-containing protein